MSDLPAFRLVRALSAPRPIVLDAAQQAAVMRRSGSGPLRVLGAPGTGRTTVLVEAAAARVERDAVAPEAVLLLAPSRRAAAALRDLITRRLGRTVREPLARSVHSYAFGLLRRAAALAGDPPPRLLAAPEQDLILRDLLAGHRGGDGRFPDWPEALRPALTTRGFRTELRDLFARAVERGIDPAGLAALGRAHQRPDWVASATLMAEYLDVTALRSPGAHDPAGLVQAAADALESDPGLLAAERDRWAVVLVDDLHDADPAAARLLHLVCGGGRDLVVAGDPDSAVLDFRGGDAALLRDFPSTFRAADGAEAASITLTTSWRRAPALVDAAARLLRRLPTPRERVAPHDRVAPRERVAAQPGEVSASGRVEVHVLAGETAEGAYIAHRLRQARLRGQLPWSQMAVIARTATRLASLRRALVAAGVPVAVASSQLTVREQPAVVPFLVALQAVLDPTSLDAETAAGLLASPLGGADPMALRRLRQALRAEERAGGGGRASDDLLVEALQDPRWLATLDHRVARPARRVATVLAAGRAACPRGADGSPAEGVTAETLLWALWQASGLEEPWRRTALAGGPAGARADRDLDAVVALFDTAARFVDRLPATGPGEFLAHLSGQEVPGDTLAERAPADDAVTLLTVHTAAGQEWDLTVVAGVYDGVWPDLRPRGSLLGSEHLLDVVTGRGGSAQAGLAQMRHEETRSFHVAISRAREHLIITSVDDDDHQPSPFLDVVDPPPAIAGSGGQARPQTTLPRALSLPAVVAELRQVVTAADDLPMPRRLAAARELARLARAGVRGAHPDQWYGVAPLSDDRPLREPDASVSVSPSRVEGFDRCALRWLLETAGGTPVDSLGQSVGTLVHALAAALPAGGAEELRAELARRWPELGLDEGWIADAEAARAGSMVAKLADYLAAAPRELVAVETDFEVTVGRARVHGRVDRLERDADGRLVVVDLKTGKSKPPKAELARHAQLGVYQLAVEHGGFDTVAPGACGSGGAALVQLGDGTVKTRPQQQPPLADDEDPGWAAALVARVADGMAAAEFPATGNPLCRTCPVRGCCPLHTEGRTVTS